MNGLLDEQSCYRMSGYPAIGNRHATHGTHVMDLATGYPSPLRTVPLLNKAAFADKPHDADIVFVQLPQVVGGRQISGLLRANVFDAVQYVIDCTPKDPPAVINLSYGTNAGPHDGTSVLEMALDWLIENHRRTYRTKPVTLVMPSGNSRESRLHACAEIKGEKTSVFHWHNLPDDPSDSFVELWFPEGAKVSVRVTTPDLVTSDWVKAGAVVSLNNGNSESVVGAVIFPRRCDASAP